jgi:hypothetical protein
VAVTQNGTGHAFAATAHAGSGIAQGVRGESLSPTGRGVYGVVNQPTGVNYGVRGDSASTQGYGVFGNATSATGLSYGLYGQATSTGGVGLSGRACGDRSDDRTAGIVDSRRHGGSLRKPRRRQDPLWPHHRTDGSLQRGWQR